MVYDHLNVINPSRILPLSRAKKKKKTKKKQKKEEKKEVKLIMICKQNCQLEWKPSRSFLGKQIFDSVLGRHIGLSPRKTHEKADTDIATERNHNT